VRAIDWLNCSVCAAEIEPCRARNIVKPSPSASSSAAPTHASRRSPALLAVTPPNRTLTTSRGRNAKKNCSWIKMPNTVANRRRRQPPARRAHKQRQNAQQRQGNIEVAVQVRQVAHAVAGGIHRQQFTRRRSFRQLRTNAPAAQSARTATAAGRSRTPRSVHTDSAQRMPQRGPKSPRRINPAL